jgi:hypothetical protein
MSSAVLNERDRAEVRVPMLPTVLLAQIDHLALLDALDEAQLGERALEQLIDDIETLDALGCEALNVLHLPDDEVRDAIAAGLQHTTVRTAATLGTAHRGRASLWTD